MRGRLVLLAAMGITPASSAEPGAEPGGEAPAVDIPYESYELDNGLKVVLHVDRSDPVVALTTLVHVGSSREEPGKTGFAHFFEHMSFNDSENVPRGSNRKLIEELGGRRNGGTSNDYTIYFEVVPADALEKLLWIDSDRLGYMINTVTEGALENEKQVVKNEKRQRVDNAPYGHSRVVISENLYPPDHPYSWPVIGSLADLQGATLDDVKAFYSRWYGPNNATLVVAGDFDVDKTKQMIADYFGEIPRGPDTVAPQPRPAELDAEVRLMHEDTFAKLPELRLTLPTVPLYHPDSYALSALSDLLTDGKRAPLYREVVEGGLAPSAFAYQRSQEVAGAFTIGVRANEGVDLDEVHAAVDRGLARFAEEGFDDRDLDRIKARIELGIYDGVSGVLDKSRQLAFYNEFAGDPGYFAEDVARSRAVTREDILRVFKTYIQDKPALITSFVPKGSPELALSDSKVAPVSEEEVVKGAEAPPATDVIGEYERTPTTFDRSQEPALGTFPNTPPPAVQVAYEDDTGFRALLMEQREVPVVSLSVTLLGGSRTDPAGKEGLASLVAKTLTEGTKRRTPEALEDALGRYGVSVSTSASSQAITLRTRCLEQDLPQVWALVQEMITEPRLDPTEFERLKEEQLTGIAAREGNPNSLAAMALSHALYGADHPYGRPISGTAESVSTLSLKDAKRWVKKNLRGSRVRVQLAGAVDTETAAALVRPLAEALKPKAAELLAPPMPKKAEAKLIFIDVPGSKQSVIRLGRVALPADDPDAYALTIANNRLGSGSSARLFQELRINKGYTYGAYSVFSPQIGPGVLRASTSVRANVTAESLAILESQIGTYADTFTEADLDVTRTVLVKRSALRFEGLGARLGHLARLNLYDLPLDTLARERAQVEGATLEGVKATIRRWYDPRAMVWVVVGDGATQRAEVDKLGLPVVERSPADVVNGR